MTDNVLCVCTGNYVRSHIAAAVLRRVASTYGDNLAIKTAGTTDWGTGKKVSRFVRAVIGKHQSTDFHPHKVTLDEVEWANVILVMEFEHERFFLNAFPRFAYKTLLISELMGERRSMPNPHHENERSVNEAARVIERYIVGGYPVLRDRLTPTPDSDKWWLSLAP